MKTAAIILAGGGGVRFGGATPKQFLEVLGRPILAYTLDAFVASERVDSIVIVCHDNWVGWTRSFVRRYGFTKVVGVIAGGETRQASSLAGLREVEALGGFDRVLIHDSVRPLVAAEVIDETVRRIDENGVVDVVAKTTDTIVRSTSGHIDEIPERAHLYNGQTPQGFTLAIALEAHARAAEAGITNATDDVQLALRLGYRPVIVDGGAQNIKVTYPHDLEVVRLFLERKIGRSRVVRLTRPFEFHEVEVPCFPSGHKVAVRPLLGSICAADLRYYAGKRRPDALAKKLPMALIHEGVGEIVFSPFPELPPGARVVIVPNVKRCDDPACTACTDERIGENYCERNAFLSSTADGLTQSLIELDPHNLLLVPDEVPARAAVMTEVLSIAVGALRRIDVHAADRVCVVGPGPVGYASQIMVAEILQTDVPLIGKGEPIPEADVYFEAVGGDAAGKAINDMIDAARPGATIVLLGVTETPVPINTRDVLQKGLRLIGASRSTPADFARTLHYLRRPGVSARVERLIIDRSFGSDELREAFDFALNKTDWGKVVVALS